MAFSSFPSDIDFLSHQNKSHLGPSSLALLDVVPFAGHATSTALAVVEVAEGRLTLTEGDFLDLLVRAIWRCWRM